MLGNVIATRGGTAERAEDLFLRDLPKVELNAYLNGSLTGKTLLKLGCSKRSVDEYEKMSKCPPRNRTLQDCSELFELAHKYMKTPKNVYLATKCVIEDYVKENVFYLELRTTPKAEDGMSKEEHIESIVRGIQESEFQNLITVKLILSIDRTHSEEESQDALKLILKMREKFPETIKGISLTGDPERGFFDERLFREARNSGLHTTLTCGEIVNNLEVERILRFRPERVSHCICVHPIQGGSLENFERYNVDRIPVECCLTSTVITGECKSYGNCPVQNWTSEPFAICTGSRGVFGTTLSQEYALFQRYYNLELPELWQISYNSLWYSFASPGEKVRMGAYLADWFHRYTLGLKFDVPPEDNRNAERRGLDVGSHHL